MAEPVAIIPDKGVRPGDNASGTDIPTARFVDFEPGGAFKVAVRRFCTWPLREGRRSYSSPVQWVARSKNGPRKRFYNTPSGG